MHAFEVEAQGELQKKIDALRLDCSRSDKQITACQLQLKKSEILLSTALYYCRQKLDVMATAVSNPVQMEELVRFSHRISATHGVTAPDDWVQGDPRRPYPNKDEIRRGYLGHLDDSGQFRTSLWDALSETAAASVNLASGTPSMGTPSAVSSSVPTSFTNVSHSTDSLTLSGSPNMMLPGVNMVSSPLAVPQSTSSSGNWHNPPPIPGTNSVDPSTNPSATNRLSNSLGALISGSSVMDPTFKLGSGLVAPPPPPSLRTIPGQCGSSSRVSTLLQKMPTNNTSRSNSLSPASANQTHSVSQPQYALDSHYLGSGPSPRSVQQTNQKRNKRKVMDDVETMSSDSSSESSSVDD